MHLPIPLRRQFAQDGTWSSHWIYSLAKIGSLKGRMRHALSFLSLQLIQARSVRAPVRTRCAAPLGGRLLMGSGIVKVVRFRRTSCCPRLSSGVPHPSPRRLSYLRALRWNDRPLKITVGFLRWIDVRRYPATLHAQIRGNGFKSWKLSNAEGTNHRHRSNSSVVIINFNVMGYWWRKDKNGLMLVEDSLPARSHSPPPEDWR